jgi:rubrerythrin
MIDTVASVVRQWRHKMRPVDADLMKESIVVMDENLAEALREWIDAQPTIESPKMRARWIFVDGYRCSACNYKLQTTGLLAYCPSCGADMRN